MEAASNGDLHSIRSSSTSISLPPELRVLCRHLTSSPPSQLLHQLPALTDYVLRCKEVLATPHDQRAKDDVSEASRLVYQLRTIITALLNGKTQPGRLTAVVLVKAVIDAGGWECLKGSEQWVRGLLAILQVRLSSQ